MTRDCPSWCERHEVHDGELLEHVSSILDAGGLSVDLVAVDDLLEPERGRTVAVWPSGAGAGEPLSSAQARTLAASLRAAADLADGT